MVSVTTCFFILLQRRILKELLLAATKKSYQSSFEQNYPSCLAPHVQPYNSNPLRSFVSLITPVTDEDWSCLIKNFIILCEADSCWQTICFQVTGSLMEFPDNFTKLLPSLSCPVHRKTIASGLDSTDQSFTQSHCFYSLVHRKLKKKSVYGYRSITLSNQTCT